MINDEEFKSVMIAHMQQQTECLKAINRIANLYEENWKVLKGVWKIGKYIVGAFLTYIGVTQGLKTLFPR